MIGKKLRRYRILDQFAAVIARMILCFLLMAVGVSAGVGELTWTKLDVDRNGRFDRADIAAVISAGPDLPTLDVNGDGKRDRKDTTAIYMALWRDDRNADLAVTAEDFARPAQVSFTPATNSQITSLAASVVAELQPKLAPGQEDRIRTAWQQKGLKEPLAAMYDRAGPAALLARNLEVAGWAYAMALKLDPGRPSALNGLGYVLIEMGKDAEAAGLLSRAAEIKPNVAAIQANLGFLAARHNMFAEASRAYDAAVAASPNVGQYRLNRAFLGVRTGKPLDVIINDAQAASTSSPGDLEAALMLSVLAPGSAPSMKEAQQMHEQHRQDLNTEPWDSLGPCDKAQSLLEAIDFEYERKWESTKDRITKDLDRQMKAVADSVMPQMRDYCTDIKRWAATAPGAIRGCQNLRRLGEINAGEELASLSRERNRRKTALIPLIFSLAGQQAIADAKAASTVLDSRLKNLGATLENASEVAKGAHAETMRYCYTEKVNTILAEGRDITAQPQKLEPDDWETTIAGIGPFVITPAVLSIEGYGRDCNVQMPKFGVSSKWALSLVLVELEYDFNEQEIKLQVGQGIIVAGTWSPSRGFGFQAGVGVDLNMGPLSVCGIEFIKFGSDGSVVHETEIGAGVKAGAGLELSSSETLIPAQNAPVGSIL